MTRIETYFKGKQSNWFVIVTFLWSVFLFSGYVNEVPTPQQTTPTEYVSSYKTKTTARSLFFAKAYTLLYAQKHPLSINGYETHFLVAFNRRIKIEFDYNTQKSLSFTHNIPFIVNKTMPQSTDDDPASPLLG